MLFPRLLEYYTTLFFRQFIQYSDNILDISFSQSRRMKVHAKYIENSLSVEIDDMTGECNLRRHFGNYYALYFTITFNGYKYFANINFKQDRIQKNIASSSFSSLVMQILDYAIHHFYPSDFLERIDYPAFLAAQLARQNMDPTSFPTFDNQPLPNLNWEDLISSNFNLENVATSSNAMYSGLPDRRRPGCNPLKEFFKKYFKRK